MTLNRYYEHKIIRIAVIIRGRVFFKEIRYALRSEQFINFNLYFSNMDLSSCLELRSSPCVASSAFLANGGGCGENNGEGIDKEEDDEVISQRPGINLVNKCCFIFKARDGNHEHRAIIFAFYGLC